MTQRIEVLLLGVSDTKIMATIETIETNESSEVTLVVTDILPTDILMGRGRGMHSHKGNVRFRELVATRKRDYLRAGRTSTKQSIAMGILNETLNRKGRFLRKLDPTDELAHSDVPSGKHGWVLADRAAVIEKVKQALRDKGLSDPPTQTSKRVSDEPSMSECSKIARVESSRAVNQVLPQLQPGPWMHGPSLQALLHHHKLERELLNRHFALAMAQVTRLPLAYATQSIPYSMDASQASTLHRTLALTQGSTLAPWTADTSFMSLPGSA